MGTRTEDGASRSKRNAAPRTFRNHVATLEAELQACRTQAAQTERLRRLGSWSLDLTANAIQWSEGTYRIFGLPPGEPVSLERALSFYPDEARAAILDRYAASSELGTTYDLVLPYMNTAGERGWVRMLGQVDVDGCGRRLVGVIEDVTVEKRAQDRLHELAHGDPLTGLPNRRAFQLRLETLASSRGLDGCALLLIDVDRFKIINDTAGHAAGDGLLRDVAACLQGCAGHNDVVARIGGDEFAIITAPVADADVLVGTAARLVEAVRSLPDPQGTLRPSVSVGLARAADSCGTPDDLLRCADLALYRAKELGRDRAELYDPELRRLMDERSRTLEAVREAIGAGRLVAVYQPIIDVRTGLVRGVEALARWDHPTRGMLPPAAFAAALADPALSVAIDDHVLRTALVQMRAWLDAGVAVAAVNVNLSEAQLRRADLTTYVTALLDEHGLAPEHLKFEVLETALLGRDTSQVARTVRRLAEIGIVCALDDFGTGYASLAHLREFRVERLKIDRSFVANIVIDPFDRALTRSMIDLGHNLGMRVTAEGVETAEQLALLKEWSCDCAQGYFVCRPTLGSDVPDAVTRWLNRCASASREVWRAVA